MADLPLLFVKILVNPKGLNAFYASIKTKSAHDKLQSIKNAWSKDEICCLEMAALLSQGNIESDKYRFNTAFLTGSVYRRYPNQIKDLERVPENLVADAIIFTQFAEFTLTIEDAQEYVYSISLQLQKKHSSREFYGTYVYGKIFITRR